MRDRLEIGPTDARIVSAGAGAAGMAHLVDMTDPAVTDAERPQFVLVGRPGAVDPPSTSAAQPPGVDPVALVASTAIAERVRAAGWTSPVVVEVDLDEGAVERITELRATGVLVGVVVPGASGAGDGSDTTSIESEVAAAIDQGRMLGLLTAVMLAGVATVRTDDPTSARRARAVVAALVGSDGPDARMGS